ncbi:MAG: hypothetical protein M3R13_05230 [Armatimonadota bacterium]|nr:hypothetical protein [Armatimonadota bacterium]
MTNSLRALAAEADLRFPQLKGHGERTASYAVGTGYELGLPATRLAQLRLAAALHYSWSAQADTCPCCVLDSRELVRFELPEATQAADVIRGMMAEWRMVPIDASILFAACRFDLVRIGIECETFEVRPGVSEALTRVSELISPVSIE